MINRILLSISLSAALVAGGAYLGYSYASNAAKVAEKEYTDKNRTLKEALKNQEVIVQEKVKYKYITNTKVITERAAKNSVTIQETLVPTMQLTNAWVSAHDAVAKGLLVTPSELKDTSLSGITDSDALAKVAKNYAICQGYVVQIEGWQDYYEQNRAFYDSLIKSSSLPAGESTRALALAEAPAGASR